MPQQYTVPQFIEREPKILGPLTVRQFLLMLVAVGLVFASYKLADLALFAVEAIIIIGVFALFAFAKVNGRPFHHFVLSILKISRRPKVRVWDRKGTAVSQRTDQKKKEQKPIKVEALSRKVLPTSKLSKLSLTVDTGGAYKED